MADKKSKKTIEDWRQGGNKEKALEMALNSIEKQFGKGAVMKLGDDKAKMNVEVTPTGSLSMDIALGIGGIPKGRIIEVFGPESSGKTTAALHMVAEVQKLGGLAGYIDAEHALDPVYAKAIGVDIANLYISQPDDGEQALDIAETMVRSGAIDLVIIDSVAALVPRAEIEGEMGDSHMGLQARLMSQALRKLTGITNKSNCTVIFINQLREKIGISFGNPETTTGGRALKFYASIRIDIRKSDSIKNGTDILGTRTKVKIAKNKLAPPFKTCEFDIMYGFGISKEGDVLDLAVEENIVNKSGAWYSYKETRIGQGRENAKQYLKEHPEELLEIENAVRKEYDLPPLGATFVSDQEAKGDENIEVEETPKKKKKGTAKAGEKEQTEDGAEITIDADEDLDVDEEADAEVDFVAEDLAELDYEADGDAQEFPDEEP